MTTQDKQSGLYTGEDPAKQEVKVWHEHDCKGNHRVAGEGTAGHPASYDHPAFAIVGGRTFVAFTEYYKGTIRAEMCWRVFELTEVGGSKDEPSAYDLFQPDQVCPWVGEPDPGNSCPLEQCPQRSWRGHENG
jgi:hypothetical protein